jgi:hypothetical protein
MTPLARITSELDRNAAPALAAVCDGDVAIEACLRVPGATIDVVVGRRRDADADTRVLAAAELIVPAHRAQIARWLAALADATDVGVKLGARPGELQVYARGDLTPQALAAAFAAAEVACTPAVVRNGLALFDQQLAVMAGLEISAHGPGSAVYGAVHRSRAVVGAIGDAFGFLTAALVPERADAARALAPALLDAPGEELVYVSFAPIAEDGWVKLDVGERPLGAARRVLEAAGLADAWPPVLARIEQLSIERWSHVGVRFDARGVAVALYWSVSEVSHG